MPESLNLAGMFTREVVEQAIEDARPGRKLGQEHVEPVVPRSRSNTNPQRFSASTGSINPKQLDRFRDHISPAPASATPAQRRGRSPRSSASPP